MSAKRIIFVWLLLAPFLWMQAFLPATAIASVSMRCVGMPESASCAQTGSMAEMAKMPCCRQMAEASNSPLPALIGRTCLFKISLISLSRGPLTPKTTRVAISVTAAPPRDATPAVSNAPVLAKVVPTSSSERYRRALLASNGLRAPPLS
jgi:hypothetical protein